MTKTFAISKSNFNLALRTFISEGEVYVEQAWTTLAGTEEFESMSRDTVDDLVSSLAFSLVLMELSGYSRSLSGEYLGSHLEVVAKAVSIADEARARGGIKKLI